MDPCRPGIEERLTYLRVTTRQITHANSNAPVALSSSHGENLRRVRPAVGFTVMSLPWQRGHVTARSPTSTTHKGHRFTL